MNDHIASTANIFAHNDRMMELALDGLTDEHATWRTKKGQGSSIRWIVGHLLSGRVSLLNMLGADLENPFSTLFAADAVGSTGENIPSIARLAADWKELATMLAAALANLTPAEALARQEIRPVADQMVRGVLMFRAWHESYHLGQIGLIRSEVGEETLVPRLRARLASAG